MIVRLDLPLTAASLLHVDSEPACGLKLVKRTASKLTLDGELGKFRELEQRASAIGRGEHEGPAHWTRSGQALAAKIREQINAAEAEGRKLEALKKDENTA